MTNCFGLGDQHRGVAVGHSEPGLTFLAAEGSPEQYVVRLRKADEKRSSWG